MKEFEIKIPTFEGYDKSPRWEASSAQAVAFEDGATFGYVNYEPSLGWYAHTLCTADDGEDELTYHFATAEEAIAHVNRVYLDLQARIAEYTSELGLELESFELPDIDEKLLEAMENMDPVELLEFLELLDEDEI
jgi:hypothetical protein